VEFPRPLTENERAVVEALLPEGGFRDVETYRAQLEAVTVVGRCTCGCPTVDLRVEDSAPRSAHPGVPSLPLWATTGDPNDAEDVVDITLWAPEGVLTELNVSWYGKRPPAELPDAGKLTVGPAPEPIRVE
jgi:hypothetical protein